MRKIILFASILFYSFGIFAQRPLPKRYPESSEDSPEKEVVIIRQTDTILAISDTLKVAPKLFASILRPFMYIQGKTEIDKKIASQRQTNFRLSQMNQDKLWLKAEIVDADLNLQSGEGKRFLLSDSTALIRYCTIDISEVCYIRLQYDIESKNIEREIAYNKDNRIIYRCYYTNYIRENGYRVVIADYQTSDNKSLFKEKEQNFQKVRYLFNLKGVLEGCDALDEYGNIIKNLLIREDSWKTVPSYDTYYRVEKEETYKNDSLLWIERYKYNDNEKGKIIEDLKITANGDTIHHLQITSTYKYDRWNRRYTIDSIDAYGNVTFSAERGVYDGVNKRNENGYHYLRKTYNYTDYPQQYQVTTNFYEDTISSDGTHVHRCIRYIEEDIYKDSTYICKEYNKDGLYVGGFKLYKRLLKEYLSEYVSFKEFEKDLQSVGIRYDKDLVVPITPNGFDIYEGNNKRAMAVSVTGERAYRLGLKDNDIIASWNGWNYAKKYRKIDKFDQLWLETMRMQNKNKELLLLRQENEKLQKIRVDLPAGNLDELQFTLVPVNINDAIDSVLLSLNYYYAYYGDFTIPILIPKNPYVRKPAVLYGLGYHPTKSYTNTRPSPEREWYYKRNLSYRTDEREITDLIPSVFFDSIKYTAWLTDDFHNVKQISDVSKDYYISSVEINWYDTTKIFGHCFNTWKNDYLTREQEQIGLPALAVTSEMNSKWSGIMPDEIIYKAVVFNNKNGFELWKKWKPSNNVRLFNDLDYKYRECIYKAKKSYIIPLDDTNIKQTLSFVSMLNHLKLKQYSAQWILLEEKHNSYCDYYIFIRYDTLNKYSTDYIKKNISSIKGVQIFIYDRKNRVAAYAER